MHHYSQDNEICVALGEMESSTATTAATTIETKEELPSPGQMCMSAFAKAPCIKTGPGAVHPSPALMYSIPSVG